MSRDGKGHQSDFGKMNWGQGFSMREAGDERERETEGETEGEERERKREREREMREVMRRRRKARHPRGAVGGLM